MSSESQKSVSYVMTKSVSTHMERDVLKLPSFTLTQQAVTHLQHYERDDIIVTDSAGKAIGMCNGSRHPKQGKRQKCVCERQPLWSSSPLITVTPGALRIMRDRNVRTTTLEDIMSSPLITVTPGTQIQNALRILTCATVTFASFP